MEDKTLNDVWHLLGQMDAKLDRVVSDVAVQDNRLDKIDSSRNFERGVIAAVSAGVSALIAIVAAYLRMS